MTCPGWRGAPGAGPVLCGAGAVLCAGACWLRAFCTPPVAEIPPAAILAEKAEREWGDIMRISLGCIGVQSVNGNG